MKRLLAVGLSKADRNRVRDILAPLGWETRAVVACVKVAGELRRQRFAAALCESELVDGDWKDVLEKLTTQAPAPPLIVTSLLTDPGLWTEVLDRGGYDVVRAPFEAGELSRVMSLAASESPRVPCRRSTTVELRATVRSGHQEPAQLAGRDRYPTNRVSSSGRSNVSHQ